MKKIAGVSPLIWAFGVVVLIGAGLMAWSTLAAWKPEPLVMVKKELWKAGGHYEVRGAIHNPRKKPAKDVTVTFKLFKIGLGAGETIQKSDLGSANANLNYLPAGATVEFTAVSDVGLVHRPEMPGTDDGTITESH